MLFWQQKHTPSPLGKRAGAANSDHNKAAVAPSALGSTRRRSLVQGTLSGISTSATPTTTTTTSSPLRDIHRRRASLMDATPFAELQPAYLNATDDPKMTENGALFLGKKILTTNLASNDEENSLYGQRRKSLGRREMRRSSVGSGVSSRRASQATIQLRSNGPAPAPSPTLASTSDPFFRNVTPGHDDIYSGLSNFTFGTARAPPRSQESISPATRMRHTPRSSIASSADIKLSGPIRSSGSMYSYDDDLYNDHEPDLMERESNFFSSSDDAASIHTFGGGSGGVRGRRGRNESRDFSSPRDMSSRSTSRASSTRFSSEDDEDSHAHAALDPVAPFNGLSLDPDHHQQPLRLRASFIGGSDSLSVTGRRDSLPMDIPGSSPSARDRQDSVATLRKQSRSLDDDVLSFMHHSNSSGVTSSTTHNQAASISQAGVPTMTISRSAGDADDVAGEFDINYILGGFDGARRASLAPSMVAANSQERQSQQRSGPSWWPVRRASNATVSTVDDTFTGLVKKYDQAASARTSNWTFGREKADGPKDADGNEIPKGEWKGMRPGAQEIWRCPEVARFMLESMQQQSVTRTDKPPQRRLMANHIPDPYSRANTRGGPQIIIHKHSRAAAFSLLRNYRSRHRQQAAIAAARAAGTTPPAPVVRTANGIMLAPRRVQEQYTSTSTTSRLRSHGLLDENGNNPVAAEARRIEELARREREKERERERERAEKMRKKKAEAEAKAAKKKEKSKGSDIDLTSSVSSSMSTSTAASTASSSRSRSESFPAIPPKSAPPTSTITGSSNVPPLPFVPSTADCDGSARSRVSQFNRRRSMAQRRDSLDFDDDLPASTRTPHQEAFSTVDPDSMSHHLAGRGGNKSKWPFSAARRRIGAGAGIPEGASPVPWMQTAPRSMQEESERQVSGVDDSFRFVGLLPAVSERSATKSANSKSKGRKAPGKFDVFDTVPEDTLYMLLPMWVGETDPASMAFGDSPQKMPQSQKQFLLVYYKAFEDKHALSRESSKRKGKNSQTSSAASIQIDDKNVFLTSFSVCGRLVTYDELRGSGVRLPDSGLSVSGPMDEAKNNLPPAVATLTNRGEQVFGFCWSRERGLELVPEGLQSLGLTYPVPEQEPLPEMVFEQREPERRLTPIGLASVEMAWAGCMALTSFGPL